MNAIRKHLTYANVVATLCLFLLVGGATAFAATQLGKNTVGTKQLKRNAVTKAKIKKNAVTTAKIKKDAVTGAKVNEATLGTVPSANLANSLPPLEPVHFVGAPGEPQFENGAQNLGSSGPFIFNPVGFYKDRQGIVHLQGVAKAGPGSPAFVFTLPPGFRPTPGKALPFEQFAESTAFIFGGNTFAEGFDLSGKVLGNEGDTVVLDGITFRAES